jgi:hypothetical protein
MFTSRILAAIAAGALSLCLAIPGADAANRALLIGLDNYADPKLSFKVKGASAGDVQAMQALLVEKLGFGAEHVKLLIDQAATKQAILGHIKSWLLAGTKPGDRALIYFAGHGYFQKDRSGDEKDGLDETLVPYDAVVTGKPGALLGGMITDDELKQAVSILTGRRVSLIVDAGHSGTLTRAITVEAKAKPHFEARSPHIRLATRSIAVEPRLKKQKTEGLFIGGKIAKGGLTVWSAVSASQHALINTEGKPGGVFTTLYVDGIRSGKADLNGNGTITNAELLTYITKGSGAYCGRHRKNCEMGLTPRLEPAAAYGVKVAVIGKTKKFITAPVNHHKPAKVLTYDGLSDYLAKGNVHGIKVTQFPASPVYVGDKVKFTVISPHDGYLILLNLRDDGTLFQLFPNKYSRQRNRDGYIRAHAPLTVPDVYYGFQFTATSASAGRIVAIVAREKFVIPKAIKTRSIEVIPRKQVTKTYLPHLAAALNRPAHTADYKTNTKAIDWSIAAMKYVIKKRY